MAANKNPWGRLKKGEASRLKKIATSGMVGGKTKKLKLPK